MDICIFSNTIKYGFFPLSTSRNRKVQSEIYKHLDTIPLQLRKRGSECLILMGNIYLECSNDLLHTHTQNMLNFYFWENGILFPILSNNEN